MRDESAPDAARGRTAAEPTAAEDPPVDTWQWDATLFAGTAAYYARGRLPYALDMAPALAAALRLDGTGQLLDLGCGPGTVTIPLAPFYAGALGVDPDPAMIEQAQRAARRADLYSMQWIVSRAEDLPLMPDRFRTITFASSFHWMDREAVAAAARAMLVSGGAVVHIDNRHQDGLRAGPGLQPVPREDIDTLRRRYLGPHRRAGQGILHTSLGDEASVFRPAGFTGPRVVIVPDGRIVVRSVDDVVAETLSMSMTAPHLFGDRLADFEADLRTLLTDAGGRFGVALPDNELNIWTPA